MPLPLVPVAEFMFDVPEDPLVPVARVELLPSRTAGTDSEPAPGLLVPPVPFIPLLVPLGATGVVDGALGAGFPCNCFCCASPTALGIC